MSAREKKKALIDECRRQYDNCLYTSTGLYIWKKSAQRTKNIFIIAPIVLGGIASLQIFTGTQSEWRSVAGALIAMLAGFFPAIFEALGMDMQVKEIGRAAAEFNNLRDRFRQLGQVGSHNSIGEFQAAFEQLMSRMEAARETSPPLPDKHFKAAQKKIEMGDYSYDVDLEAALEETTPQVRAT